MGALSAHDEHNQGQTAKDGKGDFQFLWHQLSVHELVSVSAPPVMSPGPPMYDDVVCNCVRNALQYIVPLAVDEDVPAVNGVVELLKLNEIPVVDMALSPVAVVAGCVYEVSTEPTTDKPVAGALPLILYVPAETEFHVPARTIAWIFAIEFSLLDELIGDAV
jgi:hypothetical protein